MSDFLKVISLLEQELKAAQQDLQVRTSFSSQPKPLPYEKTAIITIEKAECASAGLAGIVREGQFPTGKRVKLWFRVKLCCQSGEECWKLWDSCAQRLLFSQKLAAVCIECSEAQWDKSAGGVALPVRICCEFIIGKEREDSGNICPSEFYVVKKGESQ